MTVHIPTTYEDKTTRALAELEFNGDAHELGVERQVFAGLAVDALLCDDLDDAREWARLSKAADHAEDRVLARRAESRSAEDADTSVADLPVSFLDAKPVSGDALAKGRTA